MGRQPLFDEYEAVLLLDAYLQTLSGAVSRKDAVKTCSEKLRSMAIRKGLVIDDQYRNVSGIHFQMLSMESAYRGKTIQKAPSYLFVSVVNMYNTERSKYESILKQAMLMAG